MTLGENLKDASQQQSHFTYVPKMTTPSRRRAKRRNRSANKQNLQTRPKQDLESQDLDRQNLEQDLDGIDLNLTRRWISRLEMQRLGLLYQGSGPDGLKFLY
jgi:hypothetical protein